MHKRSRAELVTERLDTEKNSPFNPPKKPRGGTTGEGSRPGGAVSNARAERAAWTALTPRVIKLLAEAFRVFGSADVRLETSCLAGGRHASGLILYIGLDTLAPRNAPVLRTRLRWLPITFPTRQR